MTTKEAIIRILRHMKVHRIGQYPHIHIGEALTMAIDALREQEENRWIPVTERLPEEHESIFPSWGTLSDPIMVAFVCTTSKEPYPKNCVVCEAYTRNGEFQYKRLSGEYKAIAWKQRPAPPKEEPK